MSKKDNENSFFSYYQLNDAVEEVSHSFGVKETSIASAKLAGKALFNTTIFAGKIGVEIAKRLPDAIAQQTEKHLNQNPNLDPEKRQKAEDALNRYKDSKK